VAALSLRKGGPLAVTDANLLLGRLVPAYFPHIFGKSEKEPLDIEASRKLFEKLAQKINEESSELGKKDLDEIVYGSVGIRVPIELDLTRYGIVSSRWQTKRCADRSVRLQRPGVTRLVNMC
jgi:N-methylhydantoinase A/oxoprolinase/acetone carboxylase beta subunit